MENGEVVFEEPWQSRVFGMAESLAAIGVFGWDDFQAALIDAVGEWDAKATPGDEYRYWDHFLVALERMLDSTGTLNGRTIGERERELAARPHGHDH